MSGAVDEIGNDEFNESLEGARESLERFRLEQASMFHGSPSPKAFRSGFPGEYIEPESVEYDDMRFSDPRNWVASVNPRYGKGMAEYRTNCADCARVAEMRWRGLHGEAAGRRSCEGEYPERMEQWSGESLRPTTAGELAACLREAGEGASAVVASSWEVREPGQAVGVQQGHAYNVVNYGGCLFVVDGQLGTVDPFDERSQCIHMALEDTDGTIQNVRHAAIMWNAEGGVIDNVQNRDE